jgi:hypothetical protein
MSQTLPNCLVALLAIAYVYALYRSIVDSARERRELRRQALLALPAERCHRCGGEFEAWDGCLDSVRDLIDYVPGNPSYVKYELNLACLACQVRTTFWVWTDGKLTNRDRMLQPP